jgi:hypothetical protein
VAPDCRQIVGVSYDKQIIIWDKELHEIKVSTFGHDRKINAVAYSNCGSFIFTGCFGGVIKIWNAKDLSLLRTLNGHSDEIRSIDTHPKIDSIIISGGFDGEVKIWNIDDGSIITSTKQGISIIDVAFSEDGNFFAVAGQGKLISIYEFPSFKTVCGLISANSSIVNISFLNDSNYLISSSDLNNGIQIWDINKEEAIFDYEYSTKSDLGTAFSYNTISVIDDIVVRISKSEGVDVMTVKNSNYNKIFEEEEPLIKELNPSELMASKDRFVVATVIMQAKKEFDSRDFRAALNLLDSVPIELYNSAFLELKGDIFKLMKNYELAIQAYKKSLMFEKSPVVYANIGEVLTAQKEHRKAIAAYSEAISLFENDWNDVGNKRLLAQFYYNRALNQYETKQEHMFVLAIQDGKKALEVDSTYYRPYYIVAIANFQLNFVHKSDSRVNEGAQYLEEGIKYGDNNCRIIGVRIHTMGFSKEILY